MLTEIRIRNLAIIEQLTLPLAPGFNVLTGETGAGKSIIVGALGLLLGERASSDAVRTGADKAVVEGDFEIGTHEGIRALLDARGLESEDGMLVLKREVAANGRARAWVNGTTVTAAVLAELGEALVSVHGQHASQALLDEPSQRAILDAFAEAATEVKAVAASAHELADARHAITALRTRTAEAERRADWLRHVAREIADAKLSVGEDVRLDEEARRLENADELRTLASGLSDALEGDEEAVLTRLGGLQRTLAQLTRIDATIAPLQESFDAGYYALEALARELEAYAGKVELDPARLADVTRRRDLVFKLMRKHGPTLEDVMTTGARAAAELALLDGSGGDIAALEARAAAAESALRDAAARLTKRRTAAAARLAREVDTLLPTLGMPDGRFTAALLPLGEPGAHGAETVEFRVTLNLGHEARPIARVASGGELSRVMLALKTILARLDHVPTLVFDEVDAGIGGKVGLQVGDAMRRVAAHHQVFAISHLPQLAARAHHHIRVSKGAKGGVTTADVTVLAGDARVLEIARMLGGDDESAVSQAHARELLAQAAPSSEAPSDGAASGRPSRKR
jgi:DNA repair protein RecN (Recombination protein N)